jgi:hypothetical protein
MKQRNQIIVLIVLVLIAAAILGAEYWPSSGARSGPTSIFTVYQRLDFPKPEIQWGRIELRRKAEYKQSGGNLFSLVLPPPPAPPVHIPKPGDKDYVPPPPPPLPDLVLPTDMKFFGYGTVPNGTPRRAFLSYQDDVIIVGEGDTLIGRFRILKINNSNLEFEELSSGRRGQKALEDQGPSA